jgi:hypothetical protein
VSIIFMRHISCPWRQPGIKITKFSHQTIIFVTLSCTQQNMVSNPPSGASTPNPRFTSQTKTAEDLLSTQTVGLVNLSDFRKRRAEALEQKERDAHDALLNGGSSRGSPGTVTPDG